MYFYSFSGLTVNMYSSLSYLTVRELLYSSFIPPACSHFFSKGIVKCLLRCYIFMVHPRVDTVFIQSLGLSTNIPIV